MKPILDTALIGFTCILLFACTANVEEPVINQTGRTGDTCVKTCDDQHTTCVAKCNDDGCKAACESTRTSCSSACTSKDGG
jgi:hypothetical protein